MSQFPKLTLFGRSALLVTCEVLANAVCWIVAGVLFGRDRTTQPILSLALLAWTLGLRHALDADHISAIDNATRGLISMGQLPVTCGLFFSLGHSTIVVIVNVAIAISTDIYNKLDGVGTVGGIVGAAVSGAFLFIVGLANSIILWRIIQHRRRVQKREEQLAQGLLPADEADDFDDNPKYTQTFVLRLLGPIITFVDRPWKIYPVGVLFGFGFDTASSIALLAVSAIAKKDADGRPIPHADVVILPLLFTAGMTLIDSADSILMLYSYSGFPERTWAIFEKKDLRSILENEDTELGRSPGDETEGDSVPQLARVDELDNDDLSPTKAKQTPETRVNPVQSRPMATVSNVADRGQARVSRLKKNMMSGLSIILTLMSILVAFSISLITIMGLIGENCRPCREAAEADDGHGGGLAGRWWRGWANANDNSGYIGAAIVGAFVLVVGTWYGVRHVLRRRGSL